jgi:predicted transcriptional regulator
MNHEKDRMEMYKAHYAELEQQEKELSAKLDEIQKQKKPLKAYLQSIGALEIRRRGPRRKKQTVESEG